ncbi:hypothetical protein NDI76_17790 [Halogeometricum sp. S1BR25-6]|uniref:DUF8074 domain-containing protein n=1 Tax=Halogeometricum salsisoli TaxID=2950536 RepID=A0ABU2GII8_9EURY|nr:hypothetical protein [Halogeometricum sp. S1BR25-6]MDS0300605.1 hypothetical protein [Halogeometricum sp. S1BR25-6]
MGIRKTDITVYVYVLGVLLSGMWLAQQLGTDWSPLILTVVAVVAAGWTLYYRFSIGPRIETNKRDGDEHDGEDAGPSTAAKTQTGEDA